MLEQERNEIFSEIESYFQKEFGQEIDLTSQVQTITVNDYSYCFEFLVSNQAYFAKISKFDQYLLRQDQSMMPFSVQDLQFGKAEYESLISLSEKIQINNVKVIEVVAYLERTNTLITKKVKGKDFFLLLRQSSLPFNKSKNYCLPLVKDLANFYNTVAFSSDKKFISYDFQRYTKKIESYTKDLEIDFSKEQEFLDNLQIDTFQDCFEILGFKGFDIRNVIHCEDGTLKVLDPGKEKREPLESFFSRIHATLIIIFWGHPLFFINKTLKSDYLKLFEDGFIAAGSNPIIFQLELRKEFYKHWKMAVFALEQKSWPFIFKILLRKFYIDTFYIKHLKQNQSKLNSLNSEV